MCGIVGFLSAGHQERVSRYTIYSDVINTLTDAPRRNDWDMVEKAVSTLALNFDEMMSFPVFRDVVRNDTTKKLFIALASVLQKARDAVGKRITTGGSSDLVLHLNETLRDYLWQVEVEVLGFEEKVTALLPSADSKSNVQRLFVAWAAERVLSSIDKLEVRGRDSAGISIAIPTSPDWLPEPAIARELERRSALSEAETGEALLSSTRGIRVLRVLHKVANLVGKLGDNGAALRASIRADSVLWNAADAAVGVSLIAHTRWASNGLITVANCHPVSGSVIGARAGRDVLAVINGDIDNYEQLMATSVRGRGLECDRAVTTDSKILPVKVALETDASATPGERVMTALRACRGSLATAIQLIDEPTQLVIGQQGSGQALYVGRTADGWLFASEVYGLAAACRRCKALNTGGEVGVVVSLSVAGPEPTFVGNRITGETWDSQEEAISIFSRDIFRREFDYFIEKEIAEAPDSVGKTLVGKYDLRPGGVRFHVSAFGNGALLAERLRSRDKTPVRRIVVIGHGTASIAGFGIAHLMRRALAQSPISVEWSKASELFGFAANVRMDDTILVAVSQSGTTTDTNRIVDIARTRGAWVHAIVNRRNSALVQKSDSHLYTSDGRDVEMSVASTKAYYSQIAAGKVLSLFLAAELGTLTGPELVAELVELESLPSKIHDVLGLKPRIAELVETYALRARNWAVVGNGANRIAAEEIRIKLSELCYKAIPCDVTEDKKHIDLSTEPMTIVIANDLSEEVVQDTVKEVAIFRAHNGRPLIFCAASESRFDSVAEAVIRLPEIGGGLAFVLATVAGHMFGVAAAKAIDASALPVRIARAEFTRFKENPALAHRTRAIEILSAIARVLENGLADTAMPASLGVVFARKLAIIERGPDCVDSQDVDAMLTILTTMVDELSRPIDTIRHQAKTVTVGVTRPQQELSPLIEEILWRVTFSLSNIRDRDREVLEVISPLINKINGAVRYTAAMLGPDNNWIVKAEAALGESKIEHSRYAMAGQAGGSKRAALRTRSLQFSVGRTGDQSIVVVPMWRDGVPTDLLLMDLDLVPEAPSTQMISILRALRSRYDELLEAIGEYQPGRSVSDLIEGQTPRDVIFHDARWLLLNAVGRLPSKSSR